MCRGVVVGGEMWRARRTMSPPTSISKLDKVQQFQFRTSGIMLFMGVQKLHGPDLSRILQCMLQFLDSSLTFFLTTKGN